MMLQKIVLRGALVICSMSTLVTNAQEPPVFKKLIPTDAVQFASVFSGDSCIGAMMFDYLIEATQEKSPRRQAAPNHNGLAS